MVVCNEKDVANANVLFLVEPELPNKHSVVVDIFMMSWNDTNQASKFLQLVNMNIFISNGKRNTKSSMHTLIEGRYIIVFISSTVPSDKLFLYYSSLGHERCTTVKTIFWKLSLVAAMSASG